MAARRTATLGELVAAVEERVPGLITNSDELCEQSNAEIVVTGVTQDSRQVEEGFVFCAIAGRTTDGHDFAPGAAERGAVAVLVSEETLEAGSATPEICSADTARATGYLAAAFHGWPSEQLSLVGVTGTNGKTSVVSIIAHLVTYSGGAGASLGTLTGSLTTQAAPDFHRALAEGVADGVTVLGAEISSHALDQQRIAGAAVAVAVFTNLTQDHLDYHEDMDDYFEAKAKLFSVELGADCVIDVSDSYGQRLAEMVGTDATGRSVITVDGDAIAAAGTLTQRSSTFRWRGHSIELPLGGSFSVNNALLAAEAVVALGIPVDVVAEALHTVPPIPGRFETVDAGQPFSVVVDYSHTPASVEAAIQSARTLTAGRVLIVFGAGGDRDESKRPLMGRAASAADVLYVTSDNPRTEDPAKIIDQVMVGSTQGGEVYPIVDRAQAIEAAITGAKPGDIVVIAGKGHEDYQVIGTDRIDFDDRVHARRALTALGWGSDA